MIVGMVAEQEIFDERENVGTRRTFANGCHHTRTHFSVVPLSVVLPTWLNELANLESNKTFMVGNEMV